MPSVVNTDRRWFFGAAAMALAASQLGISARASAGTEASKPKNSPAGNLGSNSSFASLKQINAGGLNVGYAESGPADGSVAVLLHGWPYDIHSFVEVVPILTSAGYRVIVPYLRGYGSTRFLSSDTVRNGQQSVLAHDVIDLMDALKVQKATLAGFDWGARTANIVAALWPERCNGLVSVSGYLIGNQEVGKVPLSPRDEYQWWYQYYFATEAVRPLSTIRIMSALSSTTIAGGLDWRSKVASSKVHFGEASCQISLAKSRRYFS